MNLSIETLDGSLEKWERYVASHPQATNYHHSAWRKVIERSFGRRTHYLAATNVDGRIRAGLMSRFSALPEIAMRRDKAIQFFRQVDVFYHAC